MIVGYTTGVFDLFHIGHLNILKRARERCDFLIVGVSTDRLCLSYKQKEPVIPFVERIEIIRSCRFVDEAVPQTSLDKLEAWKMLHFNILFHGDDWKESQLYKKIEQDMSSVGVETVWLPHTDGVSSSLLAEKCQKLG